MEQDEIKSDCLWSIYYATDNDDLNLIFLMEQTELMVKVIDMLGEKEQEVFIPAMRAVGNVLTSNVNEEVLSYYIGVGLLKNLSELFNSANTSIQKEVLWCVSNIVAGPASHIQQVVDQRSIMDRIF